MLDLLMRARQKGIQRISRTELLHSHALPQSVLVKLTWAALTMPEDLVTWHGQHDIAITEKGVAHYNFRFGKGTAPAQPTEIADSVICLPGPDHYLQS